MSTKILRELAPAGGGRKERKEKMKTLIINLFLFWLTGVPLGITADIIETYRIKGRLRLSNFIIAAGGSWLVLICYICYWASVLWDKYLADIILFDFTERK